MKKIIISRPDFFAGEAVQITTLFVDGMQLLHLRKPDCTREELARLLGDINPGNYPQIALHQHHELAQEFGINRLHFPEQLRLEQTEESLQELKSRGFILSTSIHEAGMLRNLSNAFSYALLGPVFDSISKQNYRAALPPNFKLDRQGYSGEVIAIGGIDASRIQSITQMGFDGAAFLGSIWLSKAPGLKPGARDFLRAPNEFAPPIFAKGETNPISCPSFQAGENRIGRLQFISQENEAISHMESIRLALEAGCRWIQLRVKNRPEEEVLRLAWEATKLCDQYGARLIINDFPRVAQAVEAYGLHLGLTDMSVPEARELVGDRLIIGGTANSWEDIVLRVKEGADYIGLGPFRFTTTKQNLSPVLGFEGYSVLMQKMAEAEFNTPIVGIGGIMPADVPALLKAGLHGVAMSSALINVADPQVIVHQIQKVLC
ncbi:thiamine phosphate synthase [Dyadobacter crusticola]|uniref:thiamine phosphate synthase n=1 Tax=Dyadobacter crusticola TaxID=292407 RepID=UPI000A00025C|nr:thiamine phosphate synthase [Dyadobacter crusticola]